MELLAAETIFLITSRLRAQTHHFQKANDDRQLFLIQRK